MDYYLINQKISNIQMALNELKHLFKHMQNSSADDENPIEKLVFYHPGRYNIWYITTINRKTKKETVKNDKPSYIEYYTSGKLKIRRWKKENFYYKRENNLPSRERFYETGQIKSHGWYEDNNWRIRTVSYFPNGEVEKEYFPRDKVDIDNPLIIKYAETPCYHIIKKKWFRMHYNKLQPDLPLSITYNHLGKPIKVKYSYENTLKMPTLRLWDESGEKLILEEWKTAIVGGHAVYHREDGPAHIIYNLKGEVCAQYYYNKGDLIKN